MSRDFIAFCRDHGLLINVTPPFGVWRRYKTVDKVGKRNGAAKFMGDHGFVQNHATMDEVAVWKDNGSNVVDHDRLKRDIARVQGEQRRKAILARVAMAERFHSLPLLRGSHPYLERKGLSMVGCGNLRVDGELLVVPMYDCRESPFYSGPHLISYQTIAPDGTKKYRAGCSSQFATYPLTRKRAVVTCFAEGFATGAAVFQAMPTASVIVCFDAGNMVRVAEVVKPDGLCVVAADNDHETEARIGANPGIDKGQQAAHAIGCGVAWPSGIRGSDWCDALQEWGEKGPGILRMQLMRYARMRSG